MNLEHEFDGEINGHIVELKKWVKDVRLFRSAVVHLAYGLAERKDKSGILLLLDPTLSRDRILDEWERINRTLAPDIVSRFSIATLENDTWCGIPTQPSLHLQQGLQELVRNEMRLDTRAAIHSDVYAEILKILLLDYVTKQPPRTMKSLAEEAGCTYPTAAKVVKRLGPVIRREAYRSIRLERFPTDEWWKLVTTTDDRRPMLRYVDRSGQQRSPEALLRRLQNLQPDNIGLGGVSGAKFYYPNLDLVGTPRLDLTAHKSTKRSVSSVIEKLDPALEETLDRMLKPSVVVHFLNRKHSGFVVSPQGIKIADQIECLLDLNEARMEPQAEEFLESLKRTADGTDFRTSRT